MAVPATDANGVITEANHGASQLFGYRHEVEALRGEAARYNAANGITGHLVYQDGCFIRMPEGEQASVEALMAGFRRAAGLPDFASRRGRTISLIELADDSRLCYLFITGLALSGK